MSDMSDRAFALLMGVVLACILAIGFAAGSALAAKPPAPPGQGPCEHGNSQKPCKDDPQPEHGGDCDEHGPKEGGVNEDHCKGTTDPTTPTETEPTTTTPTTPEETTPSTPEETQPNESTPPVTEPGTTTPSETPGSPTPPVTSPVDSPTLEEELEEQAAANGATSSPSGTNQTPATELPYTGLPLWAWVAIGLGLVGSGIALRRRSG